MATRAMARADIAALRRQIAKIEGVLPERLAAPGTDAVVLRGDGRVLAAGDRLATGAPALDAVLGGGLPKAALTEIHGRQMRDAGTVAGFVLALLGLLLREGSAKQAPVLWIGAGGMFADAGLPYAHGLSRLFGIAPATLLFAEAPRPVDGLWIAEEAAGLKTLAAVVIELPGNPASLDLTATRRLHRRAGEAGRPVFLVRQSAAPGPTAAPHRFIVTPAPAGLRRMLGCPLDGSIGPPAFAVELDKNRLAPPARFTLEWNADEHVLEHRPRRRHEGSQDPVPLVPLPADGADLAAAAGPRLAFGPFRFPAAGHQPRG